MTPIYTATVKLAITLQAMGGRLMEFDLQGETTCRFTDFAEAQRFSDLMTGRGYIVEMGIEPVTVESAEKQVEKALASMARCMPGARVVGVAA